MRWFVIVLLCVIVYGRENPFFPTQENKELSYTTNKVHQLPPFESTKITLPDSARVLQSVVVEYKNIDGSITQKKVLIQKSIDWHQPIVISQGETFVEKPLSKKEYFEKIAQMPFISFYASKMQLKIKTTDTLLRNFLLIKPDRIVLDFKRELDFRTKSFQGKGIFQKITIGNHDGYYRVVIKLDGKYIYNIRKEKGYYLIILS